MSHSITIPRLGWSMEEGVFSEWLKSPGEYVRAGEMIFLLEGEKALQEIESFDSGYLCVPPDAPQPGVTVKVGEVIGFLLAEGESVPPSVRVINHNASTARPHMESSPPVPCQAAVTLIGHTIGRPAGPATRRLARQLGIDLNLVSTPDPTGRVLCEDVKRAVERRQSIPVTSKLIATPRARRRARELRVDWTPLTGTGRNGRIREQDVLKKLPSSSEERNHSTQEAAPTEPGRFIPATKLRLAIAQRMSAGFHQAVPVTLTTKVDATALVALRGQLKGEAVGGIVPSYNDILIHWTAQTLRERPELNASWYREGVHAYEAIHVATAVDTPSGLLAPVVRHADRLTLMEIAEQTQQLVAQARAGQLSQHQLRGGTFTISNLGMFGIDGFTPILNLPQAAILGIGRIVEEPVVCNGRLQVGQTLTLSLTFDHRVVDGAPSARWLQRLCERILTSENKQ